MGWGSIAEKLNRTLGGYGPEAEQVAEPVAEAEPKAEAPPDVSPPKPMAQPEMTDPVKPSEDPAKWTPSTNYSVYDAPAITRNSVPAGDAPVKASKPRRPRKPKEAPVPKQETEEKEQVAAVAT